MRLIFYNVQVSGSTSHDTFQGYTKRLKYHRNPLDGITEHVQQNLGYASSRPQTARKNAVFWAVRHYQCQERIISIFLLISINSLDLSDSGSKERNRDTTTQTSSSNFVLTRYPHLDAHRPGLSPKHVALLANIVRHRSSHDTNYKIGSLMRKV